MRGHSLYHQSPLTCPLHALAYEIEVIERAKDSAHVIHKEMARGHSNHNEASHNVLIRYQSKDVALNRLHYIVSTSKNCKKNMLSLTF